MKWEEEGPGWGVGAPNPRQRKSKHDPYALNTNQRQLAVGGKRTAFDRWYQMRPYGIWVCANGRQVMFNRDYTPILERRPGQPVRIANPHEWVEWVEQIWFWADSTPPYEALEAVNDWMGDWGLPPMPPMPKGRVTPGSRSERRKWPNPYESVLAQRGT